jgi:preprotein translocase subunit SecG
VYALLLTLLILDGLVMGVVILLQSGKGGGLASMGGGMGSDTLIGGRQAANLLTKTTWVTGGLFLVLSLVLAILSSRAQRPNSILRDEFRTAPASAPAPVQVPGATPVQPQQSAPAQQQPAPAPSSTTN